MKIYDISQELFSCVVWPGDPAPEKETLWSMDKGDIINLTAFSMCAHNGTHLDAPSHFINHGKNIDDIELFKVIGYAFVSDFDGLVTESDARDILNKARAISEEASKRILLKGKTTVTLEAAKVFTDLLIWQRARAWSKAIFQHTRWEPFRNDRRLLEQINDSSESVMSNIAEGFGRGTQGKFIIFLSSSI